VDLGIEGFFAVLGGLLAAGSIAALLLGLRHRRQAALVVVRATVLAIALWYVLPMIDVTADALFFPDDTVYAAGYSDGGFRNVARGDSAQEVQSVLGEPLARRIAGNDRREWWYYYSQHGPQYDNYWNKIIVVDLDSGLVVSKVDDFCSD
jgi:outer membrane protein assembly factor BamE (lipoprotein component of BamABCDE complex)